MIIIPIPCIALCHLSDATLSFLDNADDLPYVGLLAPHDNGFFMTVPCDETQAAAPADLKAIYAFMEDLATSGWFMLDVDGDIVHDLEVY